jgi:hypothetical protein
MTTAASLASRLRAMSDDDLVALVVRRRLPSTARVDDLFDLAELLRTPDSIDKALEDLPRETIVALANGRADALAEELALASSEGVDDAVFTRVTERDLLSGGAHHHPDAPSPSEGAHADPPAPEAFPGAERAFATMSALAELLRAVDAGLVRELAKGGIGTPMARNLAESSNSTPDDVVRLLRIAARVGFVRAASSRWSLADPGQSWLVASWPERWSRLVRSWRATLRPAVGDVLVLANGDWASLGPLGADAYPAGGRRLADDLAEAAEDAAALGIAVDGTLTPTGRQLFTDEDAVHAAAEVLPATVSKVYLQADLTVIAPGPLSPADDDALRRLATIESPGLAAQYRISEDSVRRAFREGLGRDDVLAILERLGATGVPQPLRYLVDQVAARDGGIIIDVGPGGTGAELRGAPDQLDLISVDVELRQLGWRRVDLGTLVTRSPLALVASRLDEQRYAAVLAAAARPLTRPEPPDRRPVPENPTARARTLVERLRAAARSDNRPPEQEWIGRQVDLAVRDRLPLRVVVRMPDASERVFTIIPTANAGGRVRGREVGADVERTLPLSLVVRVEAG